jgi:protein SCO1/2
MLAAAMMPLCAQTPARGATPPMMQGLEVEEKVGRNVDLSLTFLGEDGQPHALREYFQKGKPVVVSLVYYRCPQLCNLMLNRQAETMRQVPWMAGDQYTALTISIDPRETLNDAVQKKATYLKALDRPAPGWHYFTDHQNHAQTLANQLGYKYRLDSKTNQYVHSAAIMVLTPEGKVARYLYGVRFKAFDFRMALAEAAEGRGKFSVERVLQLCYQYDPEQHAYVLVAENLMRGGAVLCVLVLGFWIWRLWRWEKQRQRSALTPPAPVSS